MWTFQGFRLSLCFLFCMRTLAGTLPAIISFNPALMWCSREDVDGRRMVVAIRRDAWHSCIKLSIFIAAVFDFKLRHWRVNSCSDIFEPAQH